MEQQRDHWGVKPEKEQHPEKALYYKKNIIMESNITNVKNPRIIIPIKGYEQDKKVHNQAPIDHLNDFQLAFNSNPSRNLLTKDEVSFSNPKINQEYKNRKDPERIQSSQIKKVNNSDQQRLRSKSPKPENKPNNSNLSPSKNLFNIQYKEHPSLVAYFCEIFPSIEESVIFRIIKENPDISEHKLFEILSDIPTIQTKQDKIHRVKEKNQLKKNLCANLSECFKPNCEFYHSQGERRRLLENYSCRICRNDKCEAQEACPNSHTLSEIFFHSNLYKKLPCPFKECPLKHLCRFSHGHFNMANGLAEKLDKNIEELYEKKNGLMQVTSRTNEEIERLYKEKEQLRNRLVCSFCLKYRIEYVSIPCSHTLCGKCIEDVSGSQTCFKCNAQVEVLRIDYS
jgi:FtsZ-binding cell division protein ZapB